MKSKTIVVQQKVKVQYENEADLKAAIAYLKKYGAGWSGMGGASWQMNRLKMVKIITT